MLHEYVIKNIFFSLLILFSPSLKIALSPLQRIFYETMVNLRAGGGGNDLFSFATKSLVVINHLDILFKKCREKGLIVERVGEGGRWRFLVKEEEERKEREAIEILEKAGLVETGRGGSNREMLSSFFAQALSSCNSFDPSSGSLTSSLNSSLNSSFSGSLPQEKNEGFSEYADKLLSVKFPENYTPGELKNGNKMVIFFELLRSAVENGEKILVFSKSLTTLNCLEELLQNQFIPERKGERKKENEGKRRKRRCWRGGTDYYRLDGSTPAAERQRLCFEFNREEEKEEEEEEELGGFGMGGFGEKKKKRRGRRVPHLFLLSTKAGSLGINLQGASRVVLLDACFNPCHDTQALFRAYRFGQKKNVVVYRFVAQGTIEDVIFSRQVGVQKYFSLQLPKFET